VANVFRVSSAHEEGGERLYSVSTSASPGTGTATCVSSRVQVAMVRDGGRLDFRPLPGTEFVLDVDLVLLAMGFLGPSGRPCSRDSACG